MINVNNNLGHSVARVDNLDTGEIVFSLGINATQNTVLSPLEAARIVVALQSAIEEAQQLPSFRPF